MHIVKRATNLLHLTLKEHFCINRREKFLVLPETQSMKCRCNKNKIVKSWY